MSGARSRCSVAQAGKEVIPLKEGNKEGDKILKDSLQPELQRKAGDGKKPEAAQSPAVPPFPIAYSLSPIASSLSHRP